MSEKIPLQEPNDDLEGKKFWDQTVGLIEDYLPRFYVAEVKKELEQAGIEATEAEIINVRNGRSRRRAVCKAFWSVGKRHYDSLQV